MINTLPAVLIDDLQIHVRLLSLAGQVVRVGILDHASRSHAWKLFGRFVQPLETDLNRFCLAYYFSLTGNGRNGNECIRKLRPFNFDLTEKLRPEVFLIRSFFWLGKWLLLVRKESFDLSKARGKHVGFDLHILKLQFRNRLCTISIDKGNSFLDRSCEHLN